MKKNLLIILQLLIASLVSAQVVSINPNQAIKGQTLTTTITLSSGIISMGSPPMYQGDIYLEQGSFQIICNNYTLITNPFLTDSLNAEFTIPLNAPIGIYDVHVITYQCPGCPFGPTIVDNELTGGFNIIGSNGGTVSGTVYLDANLNGIRDAGENGVANQKARLGPMGYFAMTNNAGLFTIYSDSSTSTLSLLPNGYYLTSSPATFTVTTPPDTSGFLFGVARLPTISGSVYYDANNNGVRDGGEVGLRNQRIELMPGSRSTYTNSSGNYSLNSDTGTITVSIAPLPGFSLSSAPSTYTVHVPPTSSGNNFGLTALPSIIYSHDLYVYTHPMRCISMGYSGWTIYNRGPIVNQGRVTVIHSPNLTFAQSDITPTTHHGDTLTWNYSLNPFGTISSDVNYMNPVAGDTVWYTVIDSVFDSNGIFQQADTRTYTLIVSCSFDPNDKAANPPGVGNDHYTLKNSELVYTIRFQNTGNDTAFNVVVMDTMDASLDLSTFELIGSSHPVSVVTEPASVFSFMFNNIMLPDSNRDEPRSHGYIMYRIHPVANVQDFTIVNNTAYIYFDFNAAVVTNTTMNNLVTQIPLSVNSIELNNNVIVFPNPVSESATLVLPSEEDYDLKIYNVLGNEATSQKISGNFIINRKSFNSGLYYFTLRNSNGKTYSGKFLIVN